MTNLEDLEKKINSELTTKIKKSEIKHNQIYIEIDKEDLIDVTLFLKTAFIGLHLWFTCNFSAKTLLINSSKSY